MRLALAVAVLASLAFVATGFANVLHPPSLESELRVAWPPFGPHPAMLEPVVGRVIALLGNGCQRMDAIEAAVGEPLHDEEPSPLGTPQWGAILLVPRGGCTFAEKARNLQGARTTDNYPVVGLLVHNTASDDEGLVNIQDDGAGSRVRIPALHVGWREARAIGEHLRVHNSEHSVPVVLSLGYRV